MGADAGYAQADVTEFARALTGLTVGDGRSEGGGFGAAVFRHDWHEPGPRTVMGRRYADDGGPGAAGAVLDALAADPRTARRPPRHVAGVSAPMTACAPHPPSRSALTRRGLLRAGGGFSLTLMGASAAFADAAHARRKLVVIVCRGAMDGLSVSPPVGDGDYAGLRGSVAIAPDKALPVDGQFFEAQDLLETGGEQFYASTTGWLNRTLAAVGARRPTQGLAIGAQEPLIIQGPVASGGLFEGRDLAPTLDIRSVFKGVLADHLGVDRRDLDEKVFRLRATPRRRRGSSRPDVHRRSQPARRSSRAQDRYCRRSVGSA